MNTKTAKKSPKKKILVTGGAGYIGSALVPRLLAEDYDVRVFDKMIYGDFALDAVKSRIEVVVGDVVTPPSDLLDGIWGVIHLAGFSTEPTAHFSPERTIEVNYIGTKNIADMAKRSGVERFIFGSTCSAYFTYDTSEVPTRFTEVDTINPISPYSITKRAAEEYLIRITDEHFRPTSFRQGTVYGFAPKMRYDLVVNSFTKDAFLIQKMTVNANGKVYRPLLDIEHAIDAYLAGLSLPIETVGGHIFNIANSDWMILDLAHEVRSMILEKTGKEVEIFINPTGIARNYLANTDKFNKVFGLSAPRTMHAAISEIWEKLEGGHDARDPRFYTDSWTKKHMGL